MLVDPILEFAKLMFDHVQSVQGFPGGSSVDGLGHRSLMFQEDVHERADKDGSKETESSKKLRQGVHSFATGVYWPQAACPGPLVRNDMAPVTGDQ